MTRDKASPPKMFVGEMSANLWDQEAALALSEPYEDDTIPDTCVVHMHPDMWLLV